MANITERYSSAVNSKSLVVDERTSQSDSDTLGAYGLADRALTEGRRVTGPGQHEPVKPAPLAVPLARLFAGDNRMAVVIVKMLSQLAFEQSWRMNLNINRSACDDMARACLAWHKDGRCKVCGGHGFELIEGTGRGGVGGVHSDRRCEPCAGRGTVPLEEQFKPDHQQLARWMVAEMGRAAGIAGAEAMRKISERMDL